MTELEQQRASLPNDWASEEDSFASSSPSGRWTMA
jgi:ParB family chromosome partitioning protein